METIIITAVIIFVIFIICGFMTAKHNEVVEEVEQKPETRTVDAIIDVNGTSVPVSFNGLNVKFVQLPFKRELYGMEDELQEAANRGAEDYGYGCAVVVYDIAADDLFGIAIRWQPLYGIGSTIRTTVCKDSAASIAKIQRELDNALPYRR